MPDINGIPYVDADDLVSAYPAVSQSLAQEVSDQLASKLPYSYGTATPTTTDSGFLWYDSNSTPPAPKFWDGAAFQDVAPAGGLELITSDTLSGSSVSVNGCFTSDYQRYRLVARVTSSVASTTVDFRLRASGSDITTTNYDIQVCQPSGTSLVATRTTGIDEWRLSVIGTPAASLLSYDIDSPQLAQTTLLNGQAASGRNATPPELWILAGLQTDTTQADGFSLIAASGTFGGTFAVYGYKD